MLSDKNSIYWSPNCVKHYTIIIPDTFYFILLITQWQGFSTLPFYSRENWVSKKISISPFPYSGRTRTWIQSCPNSRSKLLTTILHAPLESSNGFVISPGSNLRLSSSGYAWTREDLGSLWPPSMDIIRGRRDRGKLFPNFTGTSQLQTLWLDWGWAHWVTFQDFPLSNWKSGFSSVGM